MNKSIGISQYIISILLDSELSEIVGDRVYPVDALQGTTQFPFIVVRRNSISPQYCKNGNYRDDVSFSIYIAAERYADSIAIAQTVRDLLEFEYRQTTIDNEITFGNILFTGIQEDLYNGVYIQKLDFNAIIL